MMNKDYPYMAAAMNDGKAILVVNGELGYSEIDENKYPDAAATVEMFNKKMGVSEEMARDMVGKSMFGWS
jgi:hypothetical protein